MAFYCDRVTMMCPGNRSLGLLRVLVLSSLLAQVGLAQLTMKGAGGSVIALDADGSYSVSINGPVSRLTGSLGAKPANARISSGTDSLGAYSDLAFDYTIGTSQRSGSIRAYSKRPVVLFTQTFQNASANAQPFPTFAALPKTLLHISYSGFFGTPVFTYFGADSPWVYFDGDANTLVLSPASDYMTAETRTGVNDQIEMAINSHIPILPAGFTHKSAIAFGTGINRTLASWGSALTALTGKTRPSSMAGSMLREVSYWTDNGSTYYYNPGPTSYTATLNSIKQEFQAKGVRLGSVQLDSWWYPKGPGDVWSDHGGIWTYNADGRILPTGLTGLSAGLAIPLITHSRWLDDASPHRSQYKVSGNVATDPRYWEDVAKYLHAGGVTTYEQDWLGNNAVTAMNLTDPYAFLDNMASAMSSRGMTMIYCMANPAHFLQSTNYNNVTTIRTGQDRLVRGQWDNFLYSSKLASSLHLWPFTDVFMSSERDNMLLASLSAGPLGVGDPIGTVSGKNLLQAVRSDGVIVKPDFPITPADSVYIADAKGTDLPMTATTYSAFPGGPRARYIFAYPRGANRTITIRPSDYGITTQAWLQDYLNGTGTLIQANAAQTVVLQDTSYFVLMPVGKSGLAFLGDRDQFVTLGKARVSQLQDTGRIEATVQFAAAESSRTFFGYSPNPLVASVSGRNTQEVTWDASTQLFTVVVHATRSGSAKLQISPATNPFAFESR